MSKKKPARPAAVTSDEIEQARKWLADWLKECVKRAASPKPGLQLTGTFGPNGELPDEISLGVPVMLSSILNRQHAMPRHVLDTWLFETFDARGGMVLRECERRGWVTAGTLYAPGEMLETYRVEDAAAVMPKAAPNVRKPTPTPAEIERCRELYRRNPEAQLKDITHLGFGSDKSQLLREMMRTEGLDCSPPRRRNVNP